MGGAAEMLRGLLEKCEPLIPHKKDDYTTANQLFSEASLEAPHHDLSECIDKEGYVYRIEKFCYSNPSNMMVGRVDEGPFYCRVLHRHNFVCWRGDRVSVQNPISEFELVAFT